MSQPRPHGPASVFVARQPILTRKQKVHGYELLFRSSLADCCAGVEDGDRATSRVLTGSFLLGLQRLTQGAKAFVNFPDQLLLEQYPLLCDRQVLVIEILETATITPPLVEAVRAMAVKGYRIALDDFVFSAAWEPLLEIAHLVKLDVLALDDEELERHIDLAQRHHLRLLAEKVETHQQFQRALDLGFHYFQGYFFSRPNVMSGRDIPVAKINLLRLLKMLQDPNMDYVRLGRVVAQDVSLSYKLLRFVNSAWFALPNRVESLQGAVAILGEVNFRKWVSLIALAALAEDKSQALCDLAVLRAHFCEAVAKRMAKLARRAATCYTIGMFSLLDALLDRPMAEIVPELGVSDAIAGALLRKNMDLTAAPLLLCLAYERGDWPQVDDLARRMGLDSATLPALFDEAVAAVEAFRAAV